MDEYCGSPFWNWTLSWNTNTQDPELTSCFQRTVLVWIPCVFLWIFSIFEYRLIRNSRSNSIPWSFMNGMKCGLLTTIIIFQLFELTYDLFYEFKGDLTPVVDKYTPISKLVTFCLVLLLTVLNTNHGRRTSGILFIFWFLLLICEIPAFRTAIRNPKNHPTFRFRLPYVLELLYGPTVLALFLLNCWADSAPQGSEVVENECPEKSASFLSSLFFFWVEGLARKGYTKALEFSDLWELSPENTSRVLNPPFSNYWNEKLEENKTLNTTAQVSENVTYQMTNGSADIQYVSVRQEVVPPVKQLGMFTILVKTFGGTVLFGSFLKLIQDLLMFVSPLILKLILDQIREDKKIGKEFEYWKDYFYVLILLAASMIGSLIGNQYMYRMYLLGLRIRITVVGCLYRKALRISNASKEDTSTGEIVNLMSVDAERITQLTPYLTTLWSTPLLIGLSLYFLYGLLGPSVFAGLGTMILLIPVNAYIGIRVRTFQTQQMKFKDTRIKLLNEILSGIKVLKLYAWEPSFEKQVAKIRESEINILKASVRNTALAMFIWTCAPVVVAMVTFATYVWVDEGNILDAQTAFVSLSLFNIMRLPLNLFPVMLVSIIQAGVGVKRINRYMNSPDVDSSSVEHDSKESDPIVFENANFGWYEDLLTLKNINLRVKQGSLIGVVGVVGSGKSSLLSAVLGEIKKFTGRVNTVGSVAYVAQEAWIQNATVRENILFDLPEDAELYDTLLEAAALKPDLRVLPAGDKTEIGEKGINLSGGQRQRIALARAVYNNAEIYLLDDPLSAVDAHVGKHIFEKIIGPRGLLSRKTRLLVTHGITFLPQMDQIIVLKDGEISEVGTYKELLAREGAFSDFLMQHTGSEGLNPANLDTILREMVEANPSITPRSPLQRTPERMPSFEARGDAEETETLLIQKVGKEPRCSEDPVELSKLIKDEEMETGNIKLDVVVYYMKVIGWRLAILSIIFQLGFQACAVGSNIWLAVWSSDLNQTTDGTVGQTYSRNMYLGVYGLLCFGQGLFIFIATFVMAIATLRASSFLHSMMLGRIMRAPLAFFDTTPLGRIINRFSKDTEVTDNAVPMSLSSWLKCVLNVIVSLGVIVYTTPGFIVVIIPTAVLYFLAQRFYVCTSRQLSRLESVSRSPIYSYFSETLAGAPTIRAFGVENIFIQKSEKIVDYNGKCSFPAIVTIRYLTVFLESTGNIVVFFAFLFAVLYSDHLTTGMVGLALSYALQITHGLNWLVETTNNVENNLVAVERLKEYGEIKQEAEWEIEDKKPPKTWPKMGQVTYEGFQARYREGLELVLDNVSFRIEPGEKIGVCGRTGAGKSSLALSLFRIIEGVGGSILIDGKDISEMGLHDLRRQLTIIPQDPVIFSGTVRANLDPFNEYSDDELWRSLELAHLNDFVRGLSAGLEHELSEGGENLSVGQKQLICLARALLRRSSKVLVLDEATAAIDLDTDELVQQAIRTEFNTCTVFTIAHRLNTILDYTRIIVLDKGVVKEFDTPGNLLQNKNTVFYGMAKDAGLV